MENCRKGFCLPPIVFLLFAKLENGWCLGRVGLNPKKHSIHGKYCTSKYSGTRVRSKCLLYECSTIRIILFIHSMSLSFLFCWATVSHPGSAQYSYTVEVYLPMGTHIAKYSTVTNNDF